MSLDRPGWGGRLTVRDNLVLAAYWFSTNFLWGAMLSVLLPTEVLRFVPDAAKARYLGDLTAAGALIALTAHPLVGALSDRTRGRFGRRRPYLVAGTLAACVALGWMALAPGFAALLTGFALLQLGANVASSPYQAYIPDVVPAEQRGTASGYMGLMSMLGTIASLGLAAVLVRPGRTAGFYPWLVAVLLAGMWLTVRRVPESAGEPPREPFWRSLWVSPRAHPDFAWVFATRALVMLAFYTLLGFLEYYLKDVLRLASYVQATTAVSGLAVVGAAVSTLSAGALSDRLGRRGLVCLSGLAMAVVGVAFLAVRGFPAALALGLLFGLGYGVYTSVDWALVCDVLPAAESAAAKDLGLWSIAVTLPQVVAPWLGGQLISALGSPRGYQSVFLLAAACAAAGSLLIWKVRGVR